MFEFADIVQVDKICMYIPKCSFIGEAAYLTYGYVEIVLA